MTRKPKLVEFVGAEQYKIEMPDSSALWAYRDARFGYDCFVVFDRDSVELASPEDMEKWFAEFLVEWEAEHEAEKLLSGETAAVHTYLDDNGQLATSHIAAREFLKGPEDEEEMA